MKKTNHFSGTQNQPGVNPCRKAMNGPAVYEFKVARSLSDQWTDWFDGLELARDDEGNTLLCGPIADQAALHGVLAKIRDLNLILVSVTRR